LLTCYRTGGGTGSATGPYWPWLHTVRVFVRAEQLEFVWIPLNVDEIDEMNEIIATVVHRRKIAIALFLIIEK